MGAFLHQLASLPPLFIYLVLAAGAAVENVFPPVPADSFVLIGGVLAAAGRANPWLVILFTWLANVTVALAVYTLAYRFGDAFFGTRAGRFLLHPRQLEQIGSFYRRWGVLAIFVSRFLPGLRAVVPPMAGALRVPVLRYLAVTALACTIWYGLIIWLAFRVGADWESVKASLHVVGLRVGIIAAVLIVALAVVGRRLWLRHRAKHPRKAE